MKYTGYEQEIPLKIYNLKKVKKIKERIEEDGHCLQQSSNHLMNSKLFQSMFLRFGNLMFHNCLYRDLYSTQTESMLFFDYFKCSTKIIREIKCFYRSLVIAAIIAWLYELIEFNTWWGGSFAMKSYDLWVWLWRLPCTFCSTVLH